MNNKFGACFAAFVASTLFASIANAALIIAGVAATSTHGPPTNLLNVTIASISNQDTLPGTVQIQVTDTGFNPIVSDILTAASGRFVDATGSIVSFNWYIDRNNVQFGKTELIDSFSFTALDADESFSHNFTLGLLNAISSPYSMSLQINLTLVSGGALTTTSQTEQSPVLQAVPEPATLALLGLGAAGLGFSRRKQ